MIRGRPSQVSMPVVLPGYIAPGRGAKFDVIYAIGFWPREPKRYRVYNMAEALG
jgi:hypothetical protein